MKTLGTLLAVGALAALGACAPTAAPETAKPLPAPTGGSALAGGEWKVTEIGGVPVIADVPVTIEFKEGRVFGAGSCNRFTGGYEAGAKFEIKLGMMASTMMACADGQMAQEGKYLALLAEISSYSIDSTGALILKAPDGRTIKAKRA